MKKWIYILLLFSSLSIFGQRGNELQISTKRLTPLKLSDFAEKSDAILLSKKPELVQSLYLSSQYLYIAGVKNVSQYHLSGEYIKTFDCGENVLGITGDDVKHELYILTLQKEQTTLKCYDYSGSLLRKFLLKKPVSASIYFENQVWMQQSFLQNDTVYYKLSNIDCMNGDINDFGVFHKDYYWPGFSIASGGVFSVVNGQLLFSVNTDSTLYQVRGNRFEPYLRWHIKPEKRFMSDRDVIEEHALVGRYLFVKYSRNDPEDPDGISSKNYLYVKSIKGFSDEYNVQYIGNALKWFKGLEDDLYHTGYVSLSMTINKPDCLYFTSEQKNKQTNKREYWIYLVHVKK